MNEEKFNTLSEETKRLGLCLQSIIENIHYIYHPLIIGDIDCLLLLYGSSALVIPPKAESVMKKQRSLGYQHVKTLSSIQYLAV